MYLRQTANTGMSRWPWMDRFAWLSCCFLCVDRIQWQKLQRLELILARRTRAWECSSTARSRSLPTIRATERRRATLPSPIPSDWLAMLPRIRFDSWIGHYDTTQVKVNASVSTSFYIKLAWAAAGRVKGVTCPRARRLGLVILNIVNIFRQEATIVCSLVLTV